ncbi:MAG: hypothetical protein M0C28_02995 [Candidatus Moduliflexus flocculans]|nr:hypothetical protein [Candidatus Moduliflexus flocculans]
MTIVVGRDMGHCTVSSWSQGRIDVTVPEDLRGIVGESEKEGFVWVKLHGGETGLDPGSDHQTGFCGHDP